MSASQDQTPGRPPTILLQMVDPAKTVVPLAWTAMSTHLFVHGCLCEVLETLIHSINPIARSLATISKPLSVDEVVAKINLLLRTPSTLKACLESLAMDPHTTLRN